MSKNDTRELTEFFITVQKGVRKHGIKKIVKIIQAIDLEENNMFYNEVVNYIFYVVTEEFNISKTDLVGFNKRGNVTEARKIAVTLAKEHLDISDKQLAKEFNRIRQVVYKIRKEIESYQRDDKYYKEFFIIYDKLNEKVVNHIESIKNK